MTGKLEPTNILGIASGYMSAKLLFAASEIGLFEKLGTEGKSLDQLTSEIQIPRRTLRILLDAMLALSLIYKSSDLYRNTDETAVFLSGPTSSGLRPLLRFWNRVSYSKWNHLENAIHQKGLFGEFRFNSEEQELFSSGIEAISQMSAQVLPEIYDFSRHKSILDLGGGTGYFITSILNSYPHLNATLLELPAVATIARQKLSQFEPRIKVISGDFMKDTIPEGHDVILLSNSMHIFSPERNRRLLKAIRRSVETGSKLLMIDFWTDSTHTKPLIAALIAGEFLIASGQGDVYSAEDISGWLTDCGWKFLEHTALSFPFSLVIAEAI